jgi:phosphate transport system substrate-binding protein
MAIFMRTPYDGRASRRLDWELLALLPMERPPSAGAASRLHEPTRRKDMRLFRILITCIAIALCAAGAPFAAAQPSPGHTTLVVTGSSTVAPLMIDIARRFETANKGVTIEVRTVGSGKGISDLRAGLCDIAMVSRPMSDAERDLFAYPLSRDGAALVVHRSNAVKGLTSRQLTDVLTGAITDWKQLGGRAGAIKIAWRTEGQGIPELLLHQLKLRNEQIRSHAMFFENVDAIKYAANNRNAIAIAGLALVERSMKSGVPVKALAYEGVAATATTVRDHTYSLSRPLILVTRTVPAGLQKRLVEYSMSGAVLDLQEKHGFIPYRE